jgi:hypothetical protein
MNGESHEIATKEDINNIDTSNFIINGLNTKDIEINTPNHTVDINPSTFYLSSSGYSEFNSA